MTDEFFYTHVSGLDSSAIDIAAYHEGDSLLFIRFVGGNEYVYHEVPKSLFDALIEASSPGAFYNKSISGKFSSDWHYDTALSADVNYVTDESNVSATAGKFAVRWVSEGESAEPLFDATDEADALRQFNEQVRRSEEFLGRTLNVKIEAVIHYF